MKLTATVLNATNNKPLNLVDSYLNIRVGDTVANYNLLPEDKEMNYQSRIFFEYDAFFDDGLLH